MELLEFNSSLMADRATLPIPGLFWFTRGDVFSIGYRLYGYGFVFTGLCIRVKKRLLSSASSTFLLRNILGKISVELYITLYGVCRLNFRVLDYARKKFRYRSSKLYYLRFKVNTESIIED